MSPVIRIRLKVEDGLPVCPHIQIGAKEDPDEHNWEYAETLVVFCETCKKKFTFEIHIN